MTQIMETIHSRQKADGSWTWFMKDGLGSVRSEIDTTLEVDASVNYAPYGELADVTGVSTAPYGYTGEMADDNDLVYLRARYYDPAQGVFLNLDPVEFVNRYGYVEGNPINYIDPFGLESIFSGLCGYPQLQSNNIYCEGSGTLEDEALVKELEGHNIRLTVDGEDSRGCWNHDKIKVVVDSVRAQASRIQSVTRLYNPYMPGRRRTLKDFLPEGGIDIIMSGVQSCVNDNCDQGEYAAFTCVDCDPLSIIIWNNGQAVWTTESELIFSPELISHEFGHVMVQAGIGYTVGDNFNHPDVSNVTNLHIIFNTTRQGNMYGPFIYVDNMYISVWDEFDAGPNTIDTVTEVPGRGRMYGTRGDREMNRRGYQDERAAEAYAVWVHSKYRSNIPENYKKAIEQEIEFQMGLWASFFTDFDPVW